VYDEVTHHGLSRVWNKTIYLMAREKRERKRLGSQNTL
jgi:hypothetical protein